MSMDHSGHGSGATPAPAEKPAKTGSGQTYTCPMHPEITRSEPGSCPICGMTLVPEKTKPATTLAMKAEASTEKPGVAGSAMPAIAGGTAEAGAMPDMMGDAHRAMLWPHYVAIVLGFWMITAPFTLGYLSEFIPDANQLRVMVERGLTPFAHRNMLMTISDVGSGVLIVIFGYLSANSHRRYPWAQWANAVVGGWLLLAPLVFWTPLAEAYANSTLLGIALIALSVLIPMMPGMSMEGMMGKPDIPPEWGYNPASWLQRVPIGVLALFGFLIARYMAAYQNGSYQFGLGAVFCRIERDERDRSDYHIADVQGMAGSGCGARGSDLCARDCDDFHGRQGPLAHNALDGAGAGLSDPAPRHRQHLLCHCSADCNRNLVHAMPFDRFGHVADDPFLAG